MARCRLWMHNRVRLILEIVRGEGVNLRHSSLLTSGAVPVRSWVPVSDAGRAKGPLGVLQRRPSGLAAGKYCRKWGRLWFPCLSVGLGMSFCVP